MKIGLETESCHLLFQHGRMDIFEFIELASELGLDGVQINIVPDETQHSRWGVLGDAKREYLSRVKAALDQRNLYCELDTRGSTVQELVPALRIARALGASVLRSYLRFPGGRFDANFMASQVAQVQRVVPFLQRYRIRLALENHEFETSSEMIDFISLVDQPAWVGLLCDTGNSMMAWEDPLSAIRAMAPHAFAVHFKDHLVIRDREGPLVCGVPLGRGGIDLDRAFQLFAENSRVTNINLEMCFPYCSTFKREPGTGGSSDFVGTFAVSDPPFPPDLIRPLSYYYPLRTSEKALSILLEQQREGLEDSIAVLKKLRDKYSAPSDLTLSPNN